MDKTITLLYVDDEPINRMLFEANLKKYFVVVTASSGNEGLDVLKNNSEISIVISDMKMPLMNGLEFVKEAKKTFSDLTYIILTGFDLNDEIINALDNKLIYRYLKKPYNIKDIIKSINEASGV